MKKSNVDKILVEQAKRKKHIIEYACLVVFYAILALAFLFLHSYTNKEVYIKYNETSDIDYKVYLKENDFFKEKFLGPNRSYIASLIDYIDTTFNYKISLQDENADFKYSYFIESEINVKEKNGTSSLYNYKETIINEIVRYSEKKSDAYINEKVRINYNKYNDLIKSFLSTYNLDNTNSTLTVRMYVNILGSCEDLDNKSNESVMSIEIPLTTKTMNIEMSNDLIETEDNIMACSNNNFKTIVFLFFGILMSAFTTIIIIILIRYIVKTRTAEDIYHKELKKILNNYHSYIQKINNQFNLSMYQKLKVDTFSDMLEIRDTLQQPILMVENSSKDGVYFIIPSNTKILYTYCLKVSDIKNHIAESKKAKK
ncbi:MAG: hypothetical protein IKR74_03715 [Bacilli bacterium]|nr:hypothetical protein [Bacilli bacterium]